MDELKLMVTLWPSFPHFPRFAQDERIWGIRLNSAQIELADLNKEIELIKALPEKIPLFYDVKGWQVRVEHVYENPDYLDLTLNHRISVKTPIPVLFKAGEDGALLERLEENGKRLIFRGGPFLEVRKGESLHIRHPSYVVHGPTFTDFELEKIETAKRGGFKKYFLSYVNNQRYVDEFLELVGQDCEVWLKIESIEGLRYVAREFRKKSNLFLVAACGDMYVEIERPHQIMEAIELIIEKDSEACAGSRMLLSVVDGPVPSLADFLQLAWLYDKGYRNMMLCDEICLKEELLSTAVNIFESFRENYQSRSRISQKQKTTWIKDFLHLH